MDTGHDHGQAHAHGHAHGHGGEHAATNFEAKGNMFAEAQWQTEKMWMTEWFQAWSHEQRRIFFGEMLSRVSPTDELSDLFSGIGVATPAGLQVRPEAADTQPAQLYIIWEWFKAWGPEQKNIIVNVCEGIDQAATYEFYDCFTAAEKERSHALSGVNQATAYDM